jgi:hypothetical protein
LETNFLQHNSSGGNFRKNHAGVGYTYDQTRDAFIPPKPFNSWILNEDTCLGGKHQLLYLTQKTDIIGMKLIKIGI